MEMERQNSMVFLIKQIYLQVVSSVVLSLLGLFLSYFYPTKIVDKEFCSQLQA